MLRAGAHDQLPNLVLLDIKLPKMDGFELLSEIRCKGPLKTLRVAMLTSSDEPSDVERAMALGADGEFSRLSITTPSF
jgi:CheY-like chemotaxis protein